MPVAAVLVLNTPDDGRLRPKHDPAEIKPAQCCIKLVFHLTYTRCLYITLNWGIWCADSATRTIETIFIFRCNKFRMVHWIKSRPLFLKKISEC